MMTKTQDQLEDQATDTSLVIIAIVALVGVMSYFDEKSEKSVAQTYVKRGCQTEIVSQYGVTWRCPDGKVYLQDRE